MLSFFALWPTENSKTTKPSANQQTSSGSLACNHGVRINIDGEQKNRGLVFRRREVYREVAVLKKERKKAWQLRGYGVTPKDGDFNTAPYGLHEHLQG